MEIFSLFQTTEGKWPFLGVWVVDGPDDVGGVCRVGQVIFENDLSHPKIPKITFHLCYTGANHKIQPGF